MINVIFMISLHRIILAPTSTLALTHTATLLTASYLPAQSFAPQYGLDHAPPRLRAPLRLGMPRIVYVPLSVLPACCPAYQRIFGIQTRCSALPLRLVCPGPCRPPAAASPSCRPAARVTGIFAHI
ncbi:unnamed protein product, partial [Tilletia caries]